MTSRYGRSATLAAILAVSLAGCISLLPKQNPVQLYRFGAEAQVPAPSGAVPASVMIRAAPITFDRAAAGDRILTVTGDQTAYIAGARWVTAATNLFEDAVATEFEAHGGQARLLARDEPIAADYVLKLEVRTFEVRYSRGHGFPPTVVVTVYASLTPHRGSGNGVSDVFQAEAPAATDSVHAITGAYDAAVAKVLGGTISWVETNAVPLKADA
jgi:cholesterol transport system auxiliary component